MDDFLFQTHLWPAITIVDFLLPEMELPAKAGTCLEPHKLELDLDMLVLLHSLSVKFKLSP